MVTFQSEEHNSTILFSLWNGKCDNTLKPQNTAWDNGSYLRTKPETSKSIIYLHLLTWETCVCVFRAGKLKGRDGRRGSGPKI